MPADEVLVDALKDKLGLKSTTELLRMGIRLLAEAHGVSATPKPPPAKAASRRKPAA